MSEQNPYLTGDGKRALEITKSPPCLAIPPLFSDHLDAWLMDWLEKECESFSIFWESGCTSVQPDYYEMSMLLPGHDETSWTCSQGSRSEVLIEAVLEVSRLTTAEKEV